MQRLRAVAAGVLAVATLAGCGGREPPEPTIAFDGETTLAWLVDFVQPDGALRPRTPGLQEPTAHWLRAQFDLPGWSVHLQAFNGSTYLRHDPGVAAAWRNACPADDRDAVPSLPFWNVVADYTGPRADTHVDGEERRRLALAAHWDAKEDAEGGGPVPAANDGASGVAVLHGIAVALSDVQPELPFDLRVLLLDGEDGFEDCHPLAGSIHYARTMPSGDVDRLLLLDMVGDRDARFVREGASLASDLALLDLLWEHGRQRLGATVFTDLVREVVDDHRPFIEQGVPSVDLIDYGREGGRGGFPPYWHTVNDTPDRLDAGMLQAVAEVVWATIDDPRFVAEWPLP